MKLTLEQAPKEKTRDEWAADTKEERMAIAAMAGQIVAAELTKLRSPLPELDNLTKANLITHSIQMAFTIAKAVAKEDVRRHPGRIEA